MQAIFEAPYLAPVAAALLSLIACSLIVATQHWHGPFTLDGLEGVQKFHTDPTPRIGGLPILLGLTGAWLCAPPELAKLLGVMLIASMPALLFGVAEDLSKRVSARNRLFATLASGLLACYLQGSGLNRVDVWGVDALFAFWPVSFVFTAIAVAGMANAINIIDGFNGLAAGTVLISLAALGLIAYQVGDQNLTLLCMILAGATAGFIVLNFPFGKLFLGDGGAYLMGFMLAWTSVLLLLRNPAVSVWAPLLACGYPVTEVIFSIWRRRQHDMHPFSPDSLHLHSLLKVRVVMFHFHHWRPVLRNAMVSPVMWLYAMVPALAGTVFYQHTLWLTAAAAVSALVYFFAYRGLERRKTVRHAKTFDLRAKAAARSTTAGKQVSGQQVRSKY